MTARMPRSTCRLAADCPLCDRRIKPGAKMGKDFTSNEWVHLGCLIRKVNSRPSRAVTDPSQPVVSPAQGSDA